MIKNACPSFDAVNKIIQIPNPDALQFFISLHYITQEHKNTRTQKHKTTEDTERQVARYKKLKA